VITEPDAKTQSR